MDLSPADPTRLYAWWDAKEKKEKGTYMSLERGRQLDPA